MRGIRGRRQRPEKKLESRVGGSGAASAVDGQSGWPGAAGAWRSQSLGSGNRREEWWVGADPEPGPALHAPPTPRIPETQVLAPRGGGALAPQPGGRGSPRPPSPEPAARHPWGSPASPSTPQQQQTQGRAPSESAPVTGSCESARSHSVPVVISFFKLR